MVFLKLGFLVCLLLLSFNLVALPEKIQPLIDPNYSPDANTDEGGFWYKVDKLESDLASSPHTIKGEPLNDYIDEIVCKLAGDYCGNIRVYLVDNPYFNASMYPNGMMHVWTGLLLRVENEAQLASVLAHEIGHYLRTHQITQWRKLRSGLAITTVLDVTLTFGLASLTYAGNAAAFSREQEKEADIYGVQLMAKQGYPPAAAQHLWEYIVHEREKDNSKRNGSSFWATHQEIEDLASYLADLASDYERANVVINNDLLTSKKIVEQVTPHYQRFMQGHLELREYQQLEELLKRHRGMGYPQGLVDFFEGELYRLRNEEGDRALAINSYERALSDPSNTAPAVTYRELGYLYLKQKDNENALRYFDKYLAVDSDASDKEMILFYTDSLKGS